MSLPIYCIAFWEIIVEVLWRGAFAAPQYPSVSHTLLSYQPGFPLPPKFSRTLMRASSLDTFSRHGTLCSLVTAVLTHLNGELTRSAVQGPAIIAPNRLSSLATISPRLAQPPCLPRPRHHSISWSYIARRDHRLLLIWRQMRAGPRRQWAPRQHQRIPQFRGDPTRARYPSPTSTRWSRSCGRC